jgi:homoserine O-acetyltransferase
MKVKSRFGTNYQEYEIGEVVFLAKNKPLMLVCGQEISNFPLSFQTYGELNEDKSNAILVCHALTGDQYCASSNPVTGKGGWWNSLIGDGKAVDTKKYFVIASNVLGGCMGSFGPKSINEKTGEAYGLDFPFLTVQDMVKAQNLLIEEHFGIKKLHGVIGGSFGGMQVLAWSVLFANKVKNFIPIASSYRHSPQNIAFHEVGRQAIMADSNWCNGNYIKEQKHPSKGLAVARMTAHITYLSQKALQKKFGRNLQDINYLSFKFKADFQVESYLHHQGYNFVERFDPNSYLYITKAVDYFDLESDFAGNLSSAFVDAAKFGGKFCVISFHDDWLFPPSESKKITHALLACGADVRAIAIEGSSGHDSFLLENKVLEDTIKGFLR